MRQRVSSVVQQQVMSSISSFTFWHEIHPPIFLSSEWLCIDGIPEKLNIPGTKYVVEFESLN